jgi:hypothetical protein
MRHVSRTLAALFVLVLVLAATCSAQDGAITGKVTDSSGAALPGASLTLSSVSVMGVRSVVTDEQGGYRFGLLPPGAYTIQVSGANNSTGVALVEVYDLGQGANSQPANISTRGFVDTGDNVMIGGLIVGGGSGGGICP